MRILTKALLVAVAVTFMAAGSASANSITFNITSDHCTGGCLVGATAGTIVVNDNVANQLTFTVTLLAPYNFVDTGLDATFGFNLNGNPTITYSGITAGFSANGGSPVGAQSLHIDGTGFFEYGLNCPGCGNGAPGLHGPLTFTISAAGLTLASLQQNALNQFFAVDVFSNPAAGGNGNTGALDASVGTVPDGGTTVGLLGLGMLGLGYLRRRIG